MKDLIVQQCSYNVWANKRIAQLLNRIDNTLLDKEVLSSFNSLRETVHHIWDAEIIWLSRMQQKTVNWPPTNVFVNPTITQFVETSEEFLAFVRSKDEVFLNNSTSYKNSKGETFTTLNSGIIMHCMNHSTFHRGQIVTMLRGLGVTDLLSTDLIGYLREKK